MFNLIFRLALVLSLSGVVADEMAAAQESHPFTAHDLWAMERVSSLAVSPDGEHAVFALSTTDLEADRRRSDLWVMRADGHDLRRLTSHPENDVNPVWAADSRSVYFLSPRGGSYQVWRIRLDGGEAEQVTDLPLDVGNLLLSPHGKHMAFSLEVYPDCPDLDCTVERLAEVEARPYSGLTYDRIFVRHWDTWKDGRRNHVFVMPLDADGAAPVDVTANMDADAPTKPWGGPEEVAFTPDGKGIVFTAKDVGASEPWSTDYDLYVAPIDGSRPPVCLTEDNEAWDTAPVFSPDGKTLAYLAMQVPQYESDRYRIVLRDWSSEGGAWKAGPARWFSEDWDRSARSIVWSPTGKTIYTHADNLGQRSLFSLTVKDGEARTIVRQGTVRGFGLSGGRILYTLDHLRSPVEIYSVKTNGQDGRRLTHFNDERLAAAQMGEPEQFTFVGAGGDEVYAYVVKPVDFDPAQKYPIAFLIHGGPQGSFGNDFHYRWNPQAYTGAGYAAVMVDFHGSVGYGQAFCDAINDDYGGKPLEDLQKGLAAAIERYPWLDGDRVCALGASYGGYMINWIAGNWPDRFRCLVNHDGVFDSRFDYFATEELWFPEYDLRGTPWINPESYEKHNPINFVANWKTPMLVIHGALDYRVPYTQGLAAFNALQRQGIPSKLLFFPDENHWVLSPHNGIHWHDTVIDWIDQWTKD
jgi:dipeptidyl aminopeptidase/acylaminoacyl peptidase